MFSTRLHHRGKIEFDYISTRLLIVEKKIEIAFWSSSASSKVQRFRITL